jgi:hypothetical protein
MMGASFSPLCSRLAISLQREPLEDHLIPVDGGLIRRNAEQGDAAAVMHGADQLAQGRSVAGHLEPHIEPFLHAEIFHRLVERLARDVDGARRAHLARELEPVVVHVGDHDVSRPDEASDRHRHDADGPSTGDEHVLTNHVEREGSVRGVTKRIEDRSNVVGNRVRQLEKAPGRFTPTPMVLRQRCRRPARQLRQ